LYILNLITIFVKIMQDLFNNIEPNQGDFVCHSGGAIGSDTEFENNCELCGIKVMAYSYKTKSHTSPNKVEISEEDFTDGVIEVRRANKILNRWGIERYMNLLARNWSQVKYSKQIFAIGEIIEPGGKDKKGYRNNSKSQIVSGGTGYAVAMGIINGREIFVFDQSKCKWFKWSYNQERFVECNKPKITNPNFAGIGTREINEIGKQEIKDLFERSFKK
jgi:hypothetical protein